jgi:hypothetical protein
LHDPGRKKAKKCCVCNACNESTDSLHGFGQKSENWHMRGTQSGGLADANEQESFDATTI